MRLNCPSCNLARINGIVCHETGCPDQFTAEIESLNELLEAEARSAEEHATDESGSEAEYCQSFGYGDSELDLDNLDDELRAKVDWLKAKLKPKAFWSAIQRCCELKLHDEYRRIDNSVFSQQIGEIEHQLDDDIAKRVKALPENWRRKLHWCVSSGCIYTSTGSAWHMVLSEDLLDPVIEGVKRSRPSRKRARRAGRPKAANTPMHRRAQLRLVYGGAA